MLVAHLLRKYNPSEWGGTESAIKRLCDDLRLHQVHSVVFCPEAHSTAVDPLLASGHQIRRFRACVPVWGIGPEQKRKLVAIGGNILSFTLPWRLWREPKIDLIHTHALNRLGGIALTVARLRKLPLVVSIHGGLLNLPASAQDYLTAPLRGGYEWGRFFGALLRSRKVVEEADAVITFNKTEAKLLREKYPRQRVVLQPHGVSVRSFEHDCRPACDRAFPQLIGKQFLLMVGRIDPVKNQLWAVLQTRCLLHRHPDFMLVIAGGESDPIYARAVREEIRRLGLEHRVLLTGPLPPQDSRLVGLLQKATALLLPSVTESFGLVILEAWAAGTTVISSRNPGALDLVEPGKNGWLFDLQDPASLHDAVHECLENPDLSRSFGKTGRELVRSQYDSLCLAGQIKGLYAELIAAKEQT